MGELCPPRNSTSHLGVAFVFALEIPAQVIAVFSPGSSAAAAAATHVAARTTASRLATRVSTPILSRPSATVTVCDPLKISGLTRP